MPLRCVLALFACSLLVAPAARADGTVYRAKGCGDYVFVATTTGFSVLVTNGTEGIKDGDNLKGEVEQIGHPMLLDTNSAQSVFAQVTELHLTPAEIVQRVRVRCREPQGDTFTSGYVSRTNGCGSRIFVNTKQGYAILDRIAGGVVADGDTLSGNFNRPGRITVEDQQSGSRLVVFVEDVWLSKSAVERRITASCSKQR
jgi:hypothetical protein